MKELIKPQAVSPDNNEIYTALCEVHIDVCNCKGDGGGTKWFADDDQSDIIF